MTDTSVASAETAGIAERVILPLLFGKEAIGADPTFVLLSAQPGAGGARATGRLLAEHGDELAVINGDELRAFHPRFTQLTASESADAAQTLSDATAEWLRAAMVFARENRRSLLLEGSFANPGAAVGLAQRFAGAGFRTRVVVVAARRAESLLSVASTYLRGVQTGRPTRFVSRDAHARGFDGTRALIASIEDATAVDRITVIGRDGRPVFDVEKADREQPFEGASTALISAQSQLLTSLQSAQWLSELRRVTDFTATLPDVPRPLTELLIELHETALREIIQELPVPAGSRFIPGQERRSAADLADLRRTLAGERPIDAAAPSVTPTGPDRTSPSR